jgi:hypothetical protein
MNCATRAICSSKHPLQNRYLEQTKRGKWCSIQGYPTVFAVLPCFMTLTYFVAHNTVPTWILL